MSLHIRPNSQNKSEPRGNPKVNQGLCVIMVCGSSWSLVKKRTALVSLLITGEVTHVWGRGDRGNLGAFLSVFLDA